MDKTLKRFNKESVAYVSVEQLKPESVILLDARKKEEYDVSHLKEAIWIGHKEFEENDVLGKVPNKEDSIVVYCSIGVRSENIGERLIKMGYKNVQNLYGGIFEWKNNGGKVYNLKGKETDSVHAFNKHWGKLLRQGEKVYDVPNP
jgi:rhodanese-related sulfurtransferase